MILAVVAYLIVGLIWTKWLDEYTEKNLQMPEMDTTEITFNVLFWPFQLVIFLYHLIKNM